MCAFDNRPREFDAESIGILTDLAAIAVDELLLRNLSMQDMLSGTSSRRALRNDGERLISLAVRQGTDFACAVFDIDQLGTINDRCGQAIGDIVLTAVASAARRCMRGSDVIGRMGGGSFAILLPHTRLDQAMGIVENVRAAIAASRTQSPVGSIGATCSFGVAALAPGQCFDDLLRNAGLAMNGAKQAGRNQALAWVDPAPPLAPTARRVFKAGKISFNSGHSTIDCTVRGLSRDTATIEVISTANVPEQFKLAIAADSLSRACRVISKVDHRIEVAFV